ncbi:MAG: antibiotic biosynthesis monooxygenase [Bacteroidota bacterium]|nr:antibiotic biosynthesis monooxygenase [Bacteroidota bacterium]
MHIPPAISFVVTTVLVHVKREHMHDFIEATRHNHIESVKEPGNLRFDVLQSTEDPTRFLLYEAYESEEASAAHKKTSHYMKWKEAVADWMESPRQGISYSVVVPMDRSQWR